MSTSQAVRAHRPMGRLVLASLLGNALEWYDFFLYGTAAALVFGPLFFPGADPLAGTLASLSTFTIGFLARPLGGLVFAHFGDRRGRKQTLVATLTLMGVATFLIGVLPTYATIGVWAPALLVVVRLVQGIAAGGEWGGGVLLISENAPAERRGMFSAWSQTGVIAGFALSAIAFTGARTLAGTEAAFVSWGWRLPFLLGIVLTLVGLYIRSRIDEAPEFVTARAEQATHRIPLWELLRTQRREVLIAMGARLAENTASYLFLVFALSYGKQLGIDETVTLSGVVAASVLAGGAMVGFGALSDHVGRRPVYMGGAIGLAVWAYPFFLLMQSREPAAVWLALIVGLGLCHAAMVGVQPAFFSELFTGPVRYSGMALGHELASILAGGVSPLIATLLIGWTGNVWPVALYLAAVSALTVWALAASRETRPHSSSETSRREIELMR
ncbi:MFS transporter [Streptomyces sp. NPDC000151]|uniref:MFS transporter n=1 Tax=Streptomyces sp. NPDC000151 TaxID=3154244 RepID=UPI0033265C73